MLKDLTAQQRDGIHDVGFGSLLEFRVNDCPHRLVHWLLSNFDGHTRSYDLGVGNH